MITTDIVLSAHVGGSTGKSLFTHMRSAYRFSKASDDATTTVIIIDASHGSTLYETIGVLFDKNPNIPDTTWIDSCYYFKQTSQAENGKIINFIAFRPRMRFVSDGRGLLNIFREINESWQNGIFPEIDKIDYIICETNLPQSIVTDANVMISIRDIWSEHKVNLWSTWNTSALLSQVEYTNIQDRYETMQKSGIDWYHIHNPFSTTTGLPEDNVSKSMQQCHRLTARRRYAPKDLREMCYQEAFETARKMDSSNESIWSSAYRKFLNQNERPLNLLPVYRRTNLWGRIYLTRYHYWDDTKKQYSHYRIHEPNEFPSLMDKLSEKIYSEVFVKFFDQLEE